MEEYVISNNNNKKKKSSHTQKTTDQGTPADELQAPDVHVPTRYAQTAN